MFLLSILTLVGWVAGPSSEAASRARAFLAASGYNGGGPQEDAELAKKLQEVRSAPACDDLRLPKSHQTVVSHRFAKATVTPPLHE